MKVSGVWSKIYKIFSSIMRQKSHTAKFSFKIKGMTNVTNKKGLTLAEGAK